MITKLMLKIWAYLLGVDLETTGIITSKSLVDMSILQIRSELIEKELGSDLS